MKIRYTPGIIFLALTLFVLMPGQNYASIIFVKSDAPGLDNGKSWAHAFKNLQHAIDFASPNDIICVAAGIYLPTKVHLGNGERFKTFYINKSISILGGFEGRPGTEENIEDRNHLNFPTLLSGDLGIRLDESDNAYHVVYFDHAPRGTILDGLIISGGKADGDGLKAYGGGIFNFANQNESNISLLNCFIRNNKAAIMGGAIMNYVASGGFAFSKLVNCTFINNEAVSGGGIASHNEADASSELEMISCILQSNRAPLGRGGAIVVDNENGFFKLGMVNCLVSGNDSPSSSAIHILNSGNGVSNNDIINCTVTENSGGGVEISNSGHQNSKLSVMNSILWNNPISHGLTASEKVTTYVAFSILNTTYPGIGNISDDPKFEEEALEAAPNTLGNFKLKADSPAIDAGSNSELSQNILIDIEGRPRFMDAKDGSIGRVDIGAYEFQNVTTSIHDQDDLMSFLVYPNPASSSVNMQFDDQINGMIQLLNERGQVVDTKLLNEHSGLLKFDINQLKGGIYFVNLVSTKGTLTKKLTVLK